MFQTYNDFKHLTEATLTLVPAGCMLAIAVFMFFVGLLGCLAVCKESKVLLSAVSFLVNCFHCNVIYDFLSLISRLSQYL